MDASSRLKELLQRETQVPLAELDEWFATLPSVTTGDMLGRWNGGVFNTGHPGEKMLGKLNWIGKNFDSIDQVEPIVCRGADGSRVVSAVMGQARLRMVQFRGQLTATMIYDQHPICDHFKRVDRATVLGIMDRKGDTVALYFWLSRV
jgi:hypothetical protein